MITMIHKPTFRDIHCHGRLTKYGKGLVPRNHHKSFRPRTPLAHFFRMLFTEWGMAGSATDFFELKVLDTYFGGTAYAPLATHYFLASTGTIIDAGTGAVEPVAMAYARVPVANNTTTWPNAAAGAKTNGVDLVWSEATGSWGTITYTAIMDAATSGNMLIYADVTTPTAVGSGDTLRLKAGEFDLTLT